ncbi:MAG: MMPL family transporter, partial [Verrucomicrobiota bacterium]
MASSTDSPMMRFLRKLAHTIYARPAWFVYPQIFLFLFGVAYTVKKLEFDTNRDNLVGSDKKYHQNFLKFQKEFEAQGDLVVIVESEEMEKNRQFVERLGAKLEKETNLFAGVFYKGDLKMLGQKALLFVPVKDLEELHKTLGDFRPFVNQFTRATNLESFFALINTQFRTAKQEKNAENDSLVKALPAVERIVDQARENLLRPGNAPSPGLNALFGGGNEAERQMYITFADGRLYLVTTHAREGMDGEKVVNRLRQLIQETKLEVPGLNVGLTGEPVLEYDEMAQSQKDSTLASIVALILCALIFIYGYSETRRPLMATLCLLIGLGYTMFFTTLTVGHLNILTITFVPILIGLAIDFGVHLITRYEEEIARGRTQLEAIEKALVNTGMGVLTGALTTAGAFLAMALTNFKGIQEMGWICGGGMILCLVPMMTLLPIMLLRAPQKPKEKIKPPKSELRQRIENIWLDHPWAAVGVTGALCVLAWAQSSKIYFDYDLLNMQSKDLPSVVFEKKLLGSADKSL